MAFTIIDWTFAGMSGEKVNKKIKSPETWFKLPTDVKKQINTVKIDKERQLKSVNKMKQWLLKN